MKVKYIDSEFAYDGSQLRSLFGYMDHGLLGDSIVSWTGPCDIPKDKIVDGEDLRAGEKICGCKMLHFIFEVFDQKLYSGVLIQRLMASHILNLLNSKCPNRTESFKREGDDLYFMDGKLSISIATQSPVSTMVHFALNISNEGTPVKTACLEDLGIDAHELATEVLSSMAREMVSVKEATQKVFSIK